VEAALKAIAEPRRRQILRLVWDAERSAGEIASHFDVSRPAISQHLTVLRTAGLVTDRRDGARRLYLANRDALAELQSSLEAFWRGSLETLKEEVEAEEGRGSGRGDVHRQH
jgi:DNA-binding transcriptional ArsR family regulator